MSYRPDREETEDTIRLLAERYPKCFFVDPRQRRPLKKNILADLQNDGFPAAYELISAAVDWYQSHFSYQYALEAGTKRINLAGKEVGTVTAMEHLAAQKKIKEGKANLAEKDKRNATQTLQTLYAYGRISDDHLKKLDAPMIAKVATRPRPIDDTDPAIAKVAVSAGPGNGTDPLTSLRAMWSNIDSVLAKTEDVGLRSALTAAALKVFVVEATKLIGVLDKKQ
jgi:sRNA-binding protein